MKKLRNQVVFIFLFTISFSVLSQDSLSSLNGKWNSMLESSETFKEYKVIRQSRLNFFWKEVMDSINTQNAKINQLTSQVANQKLEISSRDNEINELTSKLDESNELNDSIEFVGIQFSKGAYHILVWSIIIGLAVLILILFTMYKRSHSVTSRAQKDYQQVFNELEDFKNRAREKEVKLKRELQTAVNSLEEARRGKSI
jgi:preprotein translocase subunit SecF